MPNNHRMVDVEFSGNFSCSCKESALMMLSFGYCQLLMAGHYTPHLQGSCLLCKTSWTTTVCSLAVPGPDALLMLQVVSTALWSILNSNKKISGICFLPNIISTVVVVQSLGCVKHFATSWTTACQASLSFTISWSLVKLTFIELVLPSNHLILCYTLLFLPSIFLSLK